MALNETTNSQQPPPGKLAKQPGSGPSIGFWLVAFLCLAFGYQLLFAPKPGVKAGAPAPRLELEQLSDGKRWSPQWASRVTVLEFWATHCSVCVRKLRSSSLRAARQQKAGTQHLMINIDAPTNVKSLRNYLKQQGVPDSQWHVHQRDARYRSANLYRIRVLPSIVMIGQDGKIAHYFQGTLSDSLLKAYIKQTQGAISLAPALQVPRHKLAQRQALAGSPTSWKVFSDTRSPWESIDPI